MPRQYKLFYKRLGAEKFGQLQPGVHATLYDKPEIGKAIETIRTNPEFEGISVRLGNEHFNVIAFEQEAIAPLSFILPGEPGGPPLLHFSTASPGFATPQEGDSAPKTLA